MGIIKENRFKSPAALLVMLCFFCGCKPQPEFYINGKPFYTTTTCLESELETTWGFHYGYNILTGGFDYHYGPHTEIKCTKSVIDTVEIK